MKTTRKVVAALLAIILLSNLSATVLAAGDDLTAKAEVIALMSASEKEVMETYVESLIRDAYETKLGKSLVTQAYWPGKSWYDVKSILVAYDGNSKNGEAYYQSFAQTYAQQELRNMGIRTTPVVRVTNDDAYQLIMWFADGNTLEGASVGPEYQEISSSQPAMLFGADQDNFGLRGLWRGLNEVMRVTLKRNQGIPAAFGFYTDDGEGIDSPNVQRFLKGLKNSLGSPWNSWAWSQRQLTSNEHYYWAEYVWSQEEWSAMGWPLDEWYAGAKLNDWLNIPYFSPDEPMSDNGVKGATLGAAGRDYDRRPYMDPWDTKFHQWDLALSKTMGQWQKTTQDSFGNYENLPWTLFLYFNSLPNDFQPIFPEDVLTVAQLKQFCAAAESLALGDEEEEQPGVVSLIDEGYGAGGPSGVSGLVLGDVLYSDILAYINGYPIPTSITDGKTMVVAEDLRNYGFEVVWNADAWTLRINPSDTPVFSPILINRNDEIPVGTFMCHYLSTDVITYLGDNVIDSVAIDGQTLIDIELLTQYGSSSWDGETRELFISIDEGRLASN